MLAAQIDAPHMARMVMLAVPEPGPGEVRIDVAAAGICGTDIHIFRGTYESVYPIVPGHEFSGVVSAVGEGVTRFRPGDRVTADPNIACGRCAACQRNAFNHCENWMAVGVTRAGAFAESISVPEGQVFGIGDLGFDAAALVEPLACVVWGIKRVCVQAGDSVLIFGAGPMGCLMLQAVRRAGAARVVVVDVAAERLAVARGLGAEGVTADGGEADVLKGIVPDGFDIAADATGRPEVVTRLFDFVRPRGTVWVFGVCPPGVQATFVPYDVFRKDLRIVGSFALCKTFPEALALMHGGAIETAPLISHRLPLDQFVHGLDLAEHAPDRMKVQFVMRAGPSGI